MQFILKFKIRYFEFTKFVYERLVRQIVDVFQVVEGAIGRAALVYLLLVLRLHRIHAFQDTQSPEIKYILKL